MPKASAPWDQEPPQGSTLQGLHTNDGELWNPYRVPIRWRLIPRVRLVFDSATLGFVVASLWDEMRVKISPRGRGVAGTAFAKIFGHTCSHKHRRT